MDVPTQSAQKQRQKVSSFGTRVDCDAPSKQTRPTLVAASSQLPRSFVVASPSFPTWRVITTCFLAMKCSSGKWHPHTAQLLILLNDIFQTRYSYFLSEKIIFVEVCYINEIKIKNKNNSFIGEQKKIWIIYLKDIKRAHSCFHSNVLNKSSFTLSIFHDIVN